MLCIEGLLQSEPECRDLHLYWAPSVECHTYLCCQYRIIALTVTRLQHENGIYPHISRGSMRVNLIRLRWKIRITLTDEHYEGRPQSGPDFSNYSLPQIDWTNPIPYKERSINYENLLARLRKLKEKQLIFLLYYIFNFPQLKRSNSHVPNP